MNPGGYLQFRGGLRSGSFEPSAISLLGNFRGAVVNRPGMDVILNILEDEAIRVGR
jgi:hypothetical protein